MRYLLLSNQFRKDLPQLRREDVKLMAKLWELIDNTLDTPFIGLGKPEPLKGNLSGYWSRRINQEHRLVYKVEEDVIILETCFGHYDDN